MRGKRRGRWRWREINFYFIRQTKYSLCETSFQFSCFDWWWFITHKWLTMMIIWERERERVNEWQTDRQTDCRPSEKVPDHREWEQEPCHLGWFSKSPLPSFPAWISRRGVRAKEGSSLPNTTGLSCSDGRGNNGTSAVLSDATSRGTAGGRPWSSSSRIYNFNLDKLIINKFQFFCAHLPPPPRARREMCLTFVVRVKWKNAIDEKNMDRLRHDHITDEEIKLS